MFLVDTHCHLNVEYYPEGLAAVFKNALDNDVRRMIFASSDLRTSVEAANAADIYTGTPEIYAAVGVHPHEAAKAEPGYLDRIEELTARRRVVAIGEIGLDYFYEFSPRDVQRRVLIEQIELAKKVGKPIVLHLRDARDPKDGDANGEALEILRDTQASQVGGVVHCFSGTLKNAQDALEMGFYISFAGPLTYPRNNSLRQSAIELPLDRILCETDSPYLAPQGFRGSPNEPYHVRSVYEMLSMLKKMPTEELAEAVRKNGERIFKIGVENV